MQCILLINFHDHEVHELLILKVSKVFLAYIVPVIGAYVSFSWGWIICREAFGFSLSDLCLRTFSVLLSKGVNKDSYLILETLPTEYDSRVKAMEVDERPTEQYGDVGGLDKQIQEVLP